MLVQFLQFQVHVCDFFFRVSLNEVHQSGSIFIIIYNNTDIQCSTIVFPAMGCLYKVGRVVKAVSILDVAQRKLMDTQDIITSVFAALIKKGTVKIPNPS